MTDATNIIGIVAGICTAVSLLPQLIKIIKCKKSEDISAFTLLILLTGVAGWVWYGLRKGDMPIVVTNIFSLLVNLLVIFFSLRYKQNSSDLS